ncbi:MAG: MFS transporter [Clostridiales bacterium]|nr:MFS transporter [Clostridiales bacterium]
MTNQNISSRKSIQANLQFVGLQSFYWLSFFCQYGYAVVLLTYKGFSNSQIGVLLAFQSVASIIAQPLISSFAEKHRNIPLKRIIALQLSVSIGVMYSIFFLTTSMFWGSVIFALSGASFHAAYSLINAIGMQLQNAGYRVNYGVARGFGSLMFSVAGIVLGRLVYTRGVEIIIPAFILCASVMVVLTLLMVTPPALPPEVPKAPSVRKAYIAGAIRFFAEHRAFSGFCLATGLLLASHACLNTFVPHIVSAVGGNEADQGITRSIAAFVELPIMMAGGFLMAKFKTHRILIVSSVFFTVKALATLFAGSLGLLFAVQLLQIPAYGLFIPASVIFANESTREGERVKAQAIINVVGMGVGYMAGNMLGGNLLDHFSSQSVILAAVVFAGLGSVVMIWTLTGKKDYLPQKDSGNNSASENTLQESSGS